jgi:hypothetical protein
MIEYFTAGIAVHFRRNFSMILHSAAPRPRGIQQTTAMQYNLSHRNKANPVETRSSQTTRRGGLGFPQAQ